MPKYDIKCKDVVPDCSLEIRGASSEEENDVFAPDTREDMPQIREDSTRNR